MMHRAVLLFFLLTLTSLTVAGQSTADSTQLLAEHQSKVSAENQKATALPAADHASSIPLARVHRKDHELLLHLPTSFNHVQLLIKDALGNTVRSVNYEVLSEGFYEIPLLTLQHPEGFYLAQLVINQQVYTYQLTPLP